MSPQPHKIIHTTAKAWIIGKSNSSNFNEQSPSWEANNSSATQQIPRILRKPKVHYCVRKSHPPLSIRSQIDPVHHASLRFIFILSAHLWLGLPTGSFPHDSPLKPGMPLCSLPHVLHTLPISVLSVWSPVWYLVRSTEYKAPRYVV